MLGHFGGQLDRALPIAVVDPRAECHHLVVGGGQSGFAGRFTAVLVVRTPLA